MKRSDGRLSAQLFGGRGGGAEERDGYHTLRGQLHRWGISRLCRFHHLLLKSQLKPAHIKTGIRGVHFM